MKTRLTCPCGTQLKGANEDELVANAQAHLSTEHPAYAYSREQILFMST